ncbi:MAG: phospholipase effector Tle1 domain-containing protein [Pseudomonadota bacterium]
MTFFFDGTGNNLDADVGAAEHSNVARLYRAHEENAPDRGIYRAYVPGLGTYFKEIGDPGDADVRGAAFGRRGEDRLDWAMRELDLRLQGHPQPTVAGLEIALFGFSRGAALARAFALRLQRRVTQDGLGWRWQQGGFPVRIYFMGLFDTVASVGQPASASINSFFVAKQWMSVDTALRGRRESPSAGLDAIAFGQRDGADPTPGAIDGHLSWAKDLRLPPLVEQCVHFIAAHEVRNSFPLDSVRLGEEYGRGVEEIVFPGVHSDIGGGYRPGEGGKSDKEEELLSQVPLRLMYDRCRAAGVPLSSLGPNDSTEGDFSCSPRLLQRWHYYMSTVQPSGSLGNVVHAHMRMYYAWRFRSIRLRMAQRAAGQVPDEDARIAALQAGFHDESTALKARIKELESDPRRLAAQAELRRARQAYEDARTQAQRNGGSVTEERQAYQQAQRAFADADDAHQRELAKLATLPDMSRLAANLEVYDRNLLLDVQRLKDLQAASPERRLRTHYRGLLEAYENEFEKNAGLTDPDIIAFFDNYVHDSLAAFAKDETLPSDPRCIYVGGDKEYRFALGTRVRQVGVAA